MVVRESVRCKQIAPDERRDLLNELMVLIQVMEEHDTHLNQIQDNRVQLVFSSGLTRLVRDFQ